MTSSNRIHDLLELLKAEPEDIFLNYALGIEYHASALLPEAEIQFKKTLGLNANYIAAYYQLGKLFEEQQKITEALNYFKTGLVKAQEKKDFKAINEFGEAIFMLED
jgi:tetratricopeptide (TPR) repeat protein